MADEPGEHEVESSEVEVIEPKKKIGRPPLESIRLSREARQRLDALAAQSADEIWRCLLEGAQNGDAQCLRTICSRLWPERRGMPITFSVPKIRTAEDLAEAYDHFLHQASQGIITLDEANLITTMIERKGKALETVELAKQLADLKDQIAKNTGETEAVV